MIDIKLPIGLMFSILGVCITIYGLITMGDPMYGKTFNINMNLWSGIGMLVFGLIMLAFSKKKVKSS
jgi:membrane-bound ClpP family serine protease